MTRIRNGSGTIITDLKEVKKIIKEYFEQLYANELHSLDKINIFFRKIKTTETDLRNRQSGQTSNR